MNNATRRLLRKLRKDMVPEPEPDMSEWTGTEQFTWAVKRYGLAAMHEKNNDPDRRRWLPEELDADDARDEAILAARAAKAAAERLARYPDSEAAQQAVRETTEAADKAAKARVEANSLAEEAKRRPRPPPPPVEEEAPAKALEVAPVTAAVIDAPQLATQEPSPPPEPKPDPEWWERRAKWRLRGPADYYADDVRYECEHEYDPLTSDDE